MENAKANSVSVEKLAEAFKPEKKSKKKLISIIVLVIGLLFLVVGVAFLMTRLLKGPEVQDGEYLVSAENWTLSDGANCENEEDATNCVSSVIWNFAEIGKGTLTTNNHLNDYDFTWAIQDGKLLIETDWLYQLDNEYEYELDKSNGVLTLKSDDGEYKFFANFADNE